MKFIIGLLFTIILLNVNGQNKIDTIRFSNNDTSIVRITDKDNKPLFEKYFINQKLSSTKEYYYLKKYFGYRVISTTDNLDVRLIKEYYNDGTLRIEGYLVNGKRHGLYKTYYENGQSQCYCFYNLGKNDSTQILHNKDGSIKSISEYKDGELIKKQQK